MRVRGLLVEVLACFGDIAIIGPQFAKYLEQVLPMLAQASETEVPDRDDGLIEYLNELRRSSLDADAMPGDAPAGLTFTWTSNPSRVAYIP